jgi:hypothetical protein
LAHYYDRRGLELAALSARDQMRVLRAMERVRVQWDRTATPEQLEWHERHQPVFDLRRTVEELHVDRLTGRGIYSAEARERLTSASQLPRMPEDYEPEATVVTGCFTGT